MAFIVLTLSALIIGARRVLVESVHVSPASAAAPATTSPAEEPRYAIVPRVAASGPPSHEVKATAKAEARAREGALTTRNSAGRSGAFYLPPDFESQSLPLLVALHGTGGDGLGMVGTFRAAAEKSRFIIVAPESGFAPNGQTSWHVPDHSGETTEDHEHIRRCVDEVLAMPGVKVDTTHTLIAGYSGGGSTAPYEASVGGLYSAFAVLHGGVFVGGLGPGRSRGWFSTGASDPWRPPSRVQDAADQMRREGFGDIVYREFPGGHEAGAIELSALIQWWLGRSARQ